MIRIAFAGHPKDWGEYEPALTAALKARGIKARLDDDLSDPASVDYMVYAQNGPVQDFTPFINLKLVQSLWAGVDVVNKNETLTSPLARMVEDGLTQGMADYVMGHVMRHHLGIDTYSNAAAGEWDETPPPLAKDRTVGILGLGALGLFCGEKLNDFGFAVIGWSRSQKDHAAIGCNSGGDGLKAVIEKSDILVLLLPNTPATQNIMNADRFGLMKPGASIINPGRGPLIDDDALIAALDSGQVSQATLDVFRIEPLPKDHAFWHHPKILVTPHIASATRVDTSCDTIVDNIQRGETGQTFAHLVDRRAGY